MAKFVIGGLLLLTMILNVLASHGSKLCATKQGGGMRARKLSAAAANGVGVGHTKQGYTRVGQNGSP